MLTFFCIIGIISLMILVTIAITVLIMYIKYKKECIKVNGIDMIYEFYVKFLTIGWKIRTGGEEEKFVACISEQKYSI